MGLPLKIIVLFISLLHLYFLWLEMFAWTTRGRQVFKGFPAELFEPTRKLAANQGLYNGFLAAGLIWSVLVTDTAWQLNLAAFFLSCVFIAGVFGAITVDRKIFYVQALPAIIGMVLLVLRL